MVKIFLADNQPIVHFGMSSFLKDSTSFKLIGSASNFDDVLNSLENKAVDVLIIDFELKGFSSINFLKKIKKNFNSVKVLIYTNLSENLYAPNLIKAGASAFVHKSESLDVLMETIEKVSTGKIVFNDNIKNKLDLISKQNKSDRNYKKLSNREIEVLRFLVDGKRNSEIATILSLNEKTVSTYKLRLLAKLNVTNLIDLVNKAKNLDVI